ncbi:MAG: tRNA pseudouridine(13) synthase TruD [Gammaproteobacteria bacterium]
MFSPATGRMTTAGPSDAGSRGPVTAEERQRLGRGADVRSLPRAAGAPDATGIMRRRPEDFIVDETLPFRLSGEGEHLYLRIRKTGQNTRWVARQIAGRLGLPPKTIGFAGLKDRHAVATQWFSVHLPGRPDPDPAMLETHGIRIVEASRHTGKLRTGAVAGNRFRVVIRDLAGNREALSRRLVALRSHAVPNYFGAQRFGHGGANLDLLLNCVGTPSRPERGFGLSALRAALFNLWLSRRIRAGTWHAPLAGEIVYLPRAGRFRHAAKTAAADRVFPTGLLWGAGANRASGPALSAEQEFFESFPGTCTILADFGTRMMRRSLCAVVDGFDFSLRDDTLELGFGLSRGQFATAVVR